MAETAVRKHYKRKGDPLYYYRLDNFEGYDKPLGTPKHYKPYSRYGGGCFVMYADPAEFEEAEVPDDMVEGYARFDDGPFYPCLANPHKRWNGWAIPYFAKKEYKAIMKECKYKVHAHAYCHGEDYEMFILCSEHSEFDPHDISNCMESIAYKYKDGTYLFDGWCWDFYTEEQKQEAEMAMEE